MEEQAYILMESYLAGELSIDEKKSFEKRLKTDSEFKKDFEAYQEVSHQLEYKFKNHSDKKLSKNQLTKSLILILKRNIQMKIIKLKKHLSSHGE